MPCCQCRNVLCLNFFHKRKYVSKRFCDHHLNVNFCISPFNTISFSWSFWWPTSWLEQLGSQVGSTTAHYANCCLYITVKIWTVWRLVWLEEVTNSELMHIASKFEWIRVLYPLPGPVMGTCEWEREMWCDFCQKWRRRKKEKGRKNEVFYLMKKAWMEDFGLESQHV